MILTHRRETWQKKKKRFLTVFVVLKKKKKKKKRLCITQLSVRRRRRRARGEKEGNIIENASRGGWSVLTVARQRTRGPKWLGDGAPVWKGLVYNFLFLSFSLLFVSFWEFRHNIKGERERNIFFRLVWSFWAFG